jgi:GNAT superfamily N-acetyltransferase
MAAAADKERIQALIQEQTVRHHALDSRLPAQASLSIWQTVPHSGTCWLVEDGRRLVGALGAEREYWPEDSPFANVFPRQYVRLRLYLTDSVPTGQVLDLLLDGVAGWPGALTLAGRMVMTPVCDEALSSALRVRGFEPYHTIASRPMTAPPDEIAPGDLVIRPARRADLLIVGALMAESWRFHATYQPAITLTDRLLEGCEQQAWQLSGDGMTQSLMVAERAGEVIVFFGIGLNTQEPDIHPALFAVGYYGDILEVAVRSDQRRQGIGQAMFRAAWRWFDERNVEGLLVNYAPTNPISSRFWPQLGFTDAWINWWRAESEESDDRTLY